MLTASKANVIWQQCKGEMSRSYFWKFYKDFHLQQIFKESIKLLLQPCYHDLHGWAKTAILQYVVLLLNSLSGIYSSMLALTNHDLILIAMHFRPSRPLISFMRSDLVSL